jgi:hypothetical protein
MLRYNMLMVALSGMTIAVAASRHVADAQSGHALAIGEHTCVEYGVTPGTAAFESCVARTSRAFERGEPDIAYAQARLTRDARNVCLSYGIEPDTLGYRACVATQVERRTQR